MTMVLELARFTTHPGAADALVAERPTMIDALRRRFPACVAAYLTREADDTWLDVLVWRTREEAEEATGLIETVPECRDWFRHIAHSDGLRHVTVTNATTEVPA